MTTAPNSGTWIQVFRPSQFINGLVSYRLFVDDHDYGKLKSRKWIDVRVDPGVHVVEVVGGRSRSDAFQASTLPDEVCKVECRTRLFLSALAKSGQSLGMGKSPASIYLRTVT